jgi:hypothetical protein
MGDMLELGAPAARNKSWAQAINDECCELQNILLHRKVLNLKCPKEQPQEWLKDPQIQRKRVPLT